MYKYCQICGSHIVTAASHGTEANGKYSRDFCSNCYQAGRFSADIASGGGYVVNNSAI